MSTPIKEVLDAFNIDGSDATPAFLKKLERLDLFDMEPADLGLLVEISKAEFERRERYHAAKTVVVATLRQYDEDGGDTTELLKEISTELATTEETSDGE